MTNKNENQPEKIEKAQPMDRRKMLKSALAAGGAITAAAFMEGKWLKPVVKTGVLPVHAQSTCPFVFFIYNVTDNDPNDSSGTVDLLAVASLDKVTNNPQPGDLLEISGPISYQIIGFTGFDDLTPTAGQSGALVDGFWYGTPIIETFTYTNVTPEATVTVQYTLNGCSYTYTYDVDWYGE